MTVRLTRLIIRGFRTIRLLESFEPTPINVLIGVNGAGKSNFISFFRLLSWMNAGALQEHIASLGGANAVLHDGAQRTREMEASLALQTDQGTNEYSVRLFYAAGDTLIFADERFRFSRTYFASPAPWKELGAGHRESTLPREAEGGDKTAQTLLVLLKKCIVHQFHNTSPTARMRGKWDVNDGRWLKEDGGNLAPFLLRLQNEEPDYYHRFLECVRILLPFFAEFELIPDKHGKVLLQWRERASDLVFNAAQASDGMLRTLALLALLCQPERDLPAVLLLDEPELGLHPYAVSMIGGLIRSASAHSQVIVATQSPAFVNQFAPEEIVVVERNDRESEFRRLPVDELHDWLKEYSVAELWEKNVLGGRPK